MNRYGGQAAVVGKPYVRRESALRAANASGMSRWVQEEPRQVYKPCCGERVGIACIARQAVEERQRVWCAREIRQVVTGEEAGNCSARVRNRKRVGVAEWQVNRESAKNANRGVARQTNPYNVTCATTVRQTARRCAVGVNLR